MANFCCLERERAREREWWEVRGRRRRRKKISSRLPAKLQPGAGLDLTTVRP